MANDTALTIVGNLTADPELRVTPSGASMCRFTVASTPRIFDRETSQYRDGEPLFMTCTAWRELADHVAESLTKGARVVVTGRLRQSRWETPDGDKRSAYGLDVEDIGPSLRFATATVKKMTRTSGPAAMAPNDPWAVAGPTNQRVPVGVGASEVEPPF
ncbi:single-stranded DNA-binding protein [Solwaraspora sp. WMMB762]|uniref:single-stranded DNA-binding protein n=1 Tax=Solwaraspora sp. WMMB762 TaxID=3404120 RepID=UPI003B929E13